MGDKVHPKDSLPLCEALSSAFTTNQAVIDILVARSIITEERFMVWIEEIRRDIPKVTYKREFKCRFTDFPAGNVTRFLIESFHPQPFLLSLVAHVVVQRYVEYCQRMVIQLKMQSAFLPEHFPAAPANLAFPDDNIQRPGWASQTIFSIILDPRYFQVEAPVAWNNQYN